MKFQLVLLTLAVVQAAKLRQTTAEGATKEAEAPADDHLADAKAAIALFDTDKDESLSLDELYSKFNYASDAEKQADTEMFE